MSSNIIEANSATFEQHVLQSETPVLVDFWAPWCGPCKMIAPILDEISAEFEGKVKVVKINVDEDTETPKKYGIRGIPTLLLFSNGQVKGTKVGALNKAQLSSFITENL